MQSTAQKPTTLRTRALLHMCGGPPGRAAAACDRPPPFNSSASRGKGILREVMCTRNLATSGFSDAQGQGALVEGGAQRLAHRGLGLRTAEQPRGVLHVAHHRVRVCPAVRVQLHLGVHGLKQRHRLRVVPASQLSTLLLVSCTQVTHVDSDSTRKAMHMVNSKSLINQVDTK